jgi:hypothetical protein
MGGAIVNDVCVCVEKMNRDDDDDDIKKLMYLSVGSVPLLPIYSVTPQNMNDDHYDDMNDGFVGRHVHLSKPPNGKQAK